MSLSIARLPLLLLLLLPGVASADWPAGGKTVSTAGNGVNGGLIVRFFDLPSGDVELLCVGIGNNDYGYVLQRIDPSGELAPGWPADGVPISLVAKAYTPFGIGSALDDSTCFWFAGPMTIAPVSTASAATLVRPDAVKLPTAQYAWPVTSPATGVGPADAAAAPNGEYVAFNVTSPRIQRLTRSGSIATGWPASGLSLGLPGPGGNGGNDVDALPDGAGGAIVFCPAILSGPFAQRVDSTAVRHAGWPAAGLLLSHDPADATIYGGYLDGELIPSGSDHFIAAWLRPLLGAPPVQLKLQRFSSDGTLDPSWPANGVLAIASDTLKGVTVIPDGLGGAHVLWYAHDGSARGTHVLASGAFAPGLDSTGVALAAPGSKPFGPFNYVSGKIPMVVADSTANGGLIFAWRDTTLKPVESIRVRWLLSDYTPDPSEPSDGRLILPTQGNDLMGLHSDGRGGAYVAWEYDVDSAPQRYTLVQMTRLLASSLVGVAPTSNLGPALALSAPRPNPARGAFAFDVSLPDDAPARVELLDIAGRVVRALDVHGVGAHSLSFADLTALEPGLYFARVVQHGVGRSARILLTR